MYRTIMVPLDGSSLAERALPYARALSAIGGGDIVVIRVVPPPRYPAEFPRGGRARAIAEAETYLEGIITQFGPAVTKAKVDVDDPASAIAREIDQTLIDLLVMSTHGRAGLGSWIYGSVAEQVFRQIAMPTLIVPPRCSRAWPVNQQPRIVVPLDGSALATEALRPARDLADVIHAELQLVRIVAPPEYKHRQGHPDAVGARCDVREAESYLATMAAEVRAEGSIVTTRVVESTEPASTIASIADESNADAIAMATHGRSGVARLIMGSVAAGTIQRATVPILLVRPFSMRSPVVQPLLIKSTPAIPPTG